MAKIAKCSLTAWYLPVTLRVILSQKIIVSCFGTNFFLSFHLRKKCLSYNFIKWKNCLSYNFIVWKNAYHAIFIQFWGRKTDEKAQILIPDYEKMLVIKFYTMKKCFFFSFFIHVLFLYEIV